MTATEELPDTSPPADLYVYVGQVGNMLIGADGRAYAEMKDGTTRRCHVVATVHDPDVGRHFLLVTEGDVTP